MNETAHLRIKVETDGVTKADSRLSKFSKTSGKVERATDGLTRTIRTATAAFVAYGGAMTYKQMVGAADNFQKLNAQLLLVEGSTKGASAAYDDLLKLANQSRSDLGSTIELYSKLKRSTQELGLSNDELKAVTQAVNKSFVISGATAQEAAGAVKQLSQALASGVFRGDEFNSVAEQAPRLMQALADETGHSIGELRELAAQGKLTSEVLAKSLINQASIIESEYTKIPRTVSDALTQLSNDTLNAFGRMDTSELTQAIDGVRQIVSDPAFVHNAALVGTTLTKGFGVAVKIINRLIGGLNWLGKFTGTVAIAIDVSEAENKLKGLEHQKKRLLESLKFSKNTYGVTRGELDSHNEKLAKLDKQIAKQKELIQIKNQAANNTISDYQNEVKKLDDLSNKIKELKNINSKPNKASINLGGGSVANSIDKRIAALKKEAQTYRMTSREIELYQAKLENATPRQIELINQYYDTIEQNVGKTAFSELQLALLGEEEKIRQSYERRTQIILENTEAGSRQQHELKKRLDEEYASSVIDNYQTPSGTSTPSVANYDAKITAINEYYDRELELERSKKEASNTVIQELEEAKTAALKDEQDKRSAYTSAASVRLASFTQQQLSITTGMLKDAGKEQSLLYKTLFAIQKAAAIPSMIVSTEDAAADALKVGGAISGPALAASVRAMGYTSIGIVAGQSIAGLFDHGGMIPAGKTGIVGEYGPELISGPAQVTSRRKTESMLNGANTQSAQAAPQPIENKIRIINSVDPAVMEEFMASDEGEEIIMNVIQRNKNALGAF